MLESFGGMCVVFLKSVGWWRMLLNMEYWIFFLLFGVIVIFCDVIFEEMFCFKIGIVEYNIVFLYGKIM